MKRRTIRPVFVMFCLWQAIAQPVAAASAAQAPGQSRQAVASGAPTAATDAGRDAPGAAAPSPTAETANKPALPPALTAVTTPGADPEMCSAGEAARQAALAARSAAESAQLAADAVRALTQHIAELEQDVPTTAPVLPEWAYQVSFNALMNTGNSTSFSGKATTSIDGNWHDWSLEIRGNAAYAQNSPLGTVDLPTVFNSGLTARGTHFYTPFIGTYALASISQDRVASIRMQAFGDLGVSLIWWETERDDYIHSRLRTSIGFRALHEERHQYYPTDGEELSKMIYGPPVALNFRYGITKYAYFTEDLDITPDVTAGSDTRATSTTVLSAQVTRRTGLQLAFKVRYIGAPAPGKTNTDTELAAGINFSL